MAFGRWTATTALFALASACSLDVAVAQESTDPPPFYKFTVVAKDINAGEVFPDFLTTDSTNVSINDRGWIAFRARGLRFTTARFAFLAVPAESGFDVRPFGVGIVRYNSLQLNNQNSAVYSVDSADGAAVFRINLNNGTVENISPCGTDSAINNNNQVAFLTTLGDCVGPTVVATPRPDGGFNRAGLYIDPTVDDSFEWPRPVILDDGSVLIRAGNQRDAPIRLYSNDLSSWESIASSSDFSRLGPLPGASEDGQVVVFYGNDFLGPGIFASVRKGASRDIIRIAGIGDDSPFTGFEAHAAVAVNSTQAGERITGSGWDAFEDRNNNGVHDSEQRAVTVAFVAYGSTGKKGIYTARVNFFGDGDHFFDPSSPHQVTASRPTLVVEQGQVIPGLDGHIQSVDLGDSVNNRDRGDLVVWVKTDVLAPGGSPMQGIVLARPQQVVYLDFDPVHNFELTPLAQGLFSAVDGHAPDSWEGTMADAFATIAPARNDLHSNVGNIQNDIVDLVQKAFSDSAINVKVLGRMLDASNDPLPTDGPFVHVFIGDGPYTDRNPSPTNAVSALDLFNRGDAAGIGRYSMTVPVPIQQTVFVFVDNLFRVADENGDGTPEGNFSTCPAPYTCTPPWSRVSLNQTVGEGMIQFDEVEHAIASMVSHELGHTLGLLHLRNDLNSLIMNQYSDPDENRLPKHFNDNGSRTIETAFGLQNDRNRLALSVGSDVNPFDRSAPAIGGLPRDEPSGGALALVKRELFNLRAPVPPGSISVTRAVLGVVPFGQYDLLPELLDLGSGDLATVLSRPIAVGLRDKIFLFASTTGNGIDIFSLAPGITPATPIDLSNPLLVLTEPRIRGSAFDALGQPQRTVWQLVQLTPGGIVSLGTVGASDAVAPNLQSIAVTPADVEIGKSDTHQFRVVGTFTDGSTQDLTSRVSWSSSDESVASIDATGLATAIAAGTATIEAAVGDLRATATLNVAGIITRTERVSVSTAGTQTDSDSYSVSMSGDGRLVAFMSFADNLVAGDTNAVPDIFVHDRSLNTTERVSVSTAGAEAAPTRDLADRSVGSFSPLISGDGRFVAFDSAADNLVPNDTNCDRDVFVHDRETGMTERVNVSGSGAQASLFGLVCNSNTSMFNQASSISGDGRFVAFLSGADNLVPGFRQSFPPKTFAYIRDRQAGTTEQIAQTTDAPALSADGRLVAFSATRCGPDFVSRTPVVCVLDRIGGAFEVMSVSSAGDPADAVADNAAISADGRFVAFASTAGNLVSDPGPAGIYQVYLHDRLSGGTQRISLSDTGGQITATLLGNQVNLDSKYPAIASDGRVAFTAGTIVPAPLGFVVTSKVFLRDSVAGATESISVSRSGGTADGAELGQPRVGISADGRFVTFSSYATDLVVSDTNSYSDVFVRDRGAAVPPPPPPPPPSDTVAPVTSAALSSPPTASGWNNSDTTVTLSAVDNPGGSGVKNITVSAAGAQPFAATLFNGASATVAITTEGVTTISFFATDEAGNVEAARTLVIRVDKSGPIITGSRAPLANANGWNNTDVTVSFACSDALSGLAPGSPPLDVVVSTEGAGQSVTGSCRDQAGNTASAVVSGINIDKSPPALSCVAGPALLWPPDHRLVPVSVVINAADGGSGLASYTLLSAVSNEPDNGLGDGDTAKDIQGWNIGTADVSGWLRAERSGLGSGRIYTLRYQGIDRAANTGSCSVVITVPHDQY